MGVAALRGVQYYYIPFHVWIKPPPPPPPPLPGHMHVYIYTYNTASSIGEPDVHCHMGLDRVDAAIADVWRRLLDPEATRGTDMGYLWSYLTLNYLSLLVVFRVIKLLL